MVRAYAGAIQHVDLADDQESLHHDQDHESTNSHPDNGTDDPQHPDESDGQKSGTRRIPLAGTLEAAAVAAVRLNRSN